MSTSKIKLIINFFFLLITCNCWYLQEILQLVWLQKLRNISFKVAKKALFTDPLKTRAINLCNTQTYRRSTGLEICICIKNIAERSFSVNGTRRLDYSDERRITNTYAALSMSSTFKRASFHSRLWTRSKKDTRRRRPFAHHRLLCRWRKKKKKKKTCRDDGQVGWDTQARASGSRRNLLTPLPRWPSTRHWQDMKS